AGAEGTVRPSIGATVRPLRQHRDGRPSHLDHRDGDALDRQPNGQGGRVLPLSAQVAAVGGDVRHAAARSGTGELERLPRVLAAPGDPIGLAPVHPHAAGAEAVLPPRRRRVRDRAARHLGAAPLLARLDGVGPGGSGLDAVERQPRQEVSKVPRSWTTDCATALSDARAFTNSPGEATRPANTGLRTLLTLSTL